MSRSTNLMPEDEQLTEVDRRLIAELQIDGRAPFSTLAETLGISEATAQRRTQQLVDQGFFKIIGTVDPMHLGHGHAVMVALRCDPQAIHQVVDAVAAIPQVRFLALVTGMHDIVCEVVTFDRESTTDVLIGELSAIPGIRSVNTSWVLENHKTNYRWDALQSGTITAPAISGGSAPSRRDDELLLDDLDHRIVDMLASNGRASYAQIATELGTTLSTARRRTLRLLQSGYITVVAIGNPFRLGFAEVVLLWLKVDLARTVDVLRTLEGERAIRYLSRIAGEADILAEGFFPHRGALLNFLNGPLAEVEGIKEASLSFELLIRKRAYTLFESRDRVRNRPPQPLSP
jgi:DNA-binding Lrp family transcriptional regulator